MEDEHDNQLATDWLLGIASGNDPHYRSRQYLKPGDDREIAARAALARLLRKEAPDGYFANILAAMIDPSPTGTHSVVVKQTIQFVRPRGGPKASDRGDLEILTFMQEWREKNPAATVEETVYTASECLDVSESRAWQAWKRPFGASQSAALIPAPSWIKEALKSLILLLQSNPRI